MQSKYERTRIAKERDVEVVSGGNEPTTVPDENRPEGCLVRQYD